MEEIKGKNIYVNIPHAGRFQLDTLLEEVKLLRETAWIYKIWRPTPALIDKTSGSSTQYVGQKFDSSHFDLVETRWTHDHCEFCSQTISDIDGYGETDGYTSNNDWLCKNCYTLFIEPKNIDSLINNLQVEK